MKLKTWGVLLFAAFSLQLSSPTISQAFKEESSTPELIKIRKERREKSIKDLEKVLQEEYNPKFYINDTWRSWAIGGDSNIIDLHFTYDINFLTKTLKDEEFKKICQYLQKNYNYKLGKNILKLVYSYREINGFEEINSWLKDLGIEEEKKYDAFIAFTTHLNSRSVLSYNSLNSTSLEEFAWDVFKINPKFLVDLAVLTEFDYSSYSSIPKDLLKAYPEEMIEIARNIGDNGNIITATFDYLNKDLMEKHKERLVEISTIAEKYTEEIYWFMDLTGAIPDDESILKFKTSMEQDQELTYEELKKIYTRIGDENLIGALEFFKGTPAYSEKRSVRLVDHIHDLKNALVLHYAKENGLDIKSLNTLKIKLFSEYFIDNAELYNQMPYVQNERVNGIIGERPSLKEYKTYLELNKNIAQAMVNAYNNEKEMGEEVKKEVFDLINSTTRTLAGVVNTLHNNTHLREKAASELTPEIIYFTIAQGDEIFTSSFNLLYDNLAYKLNNGKGILTQDIERRTQVQQRIVDEGKCKILDYIGNIDREEKRLTRFLMTSSLYGRLDEIMPKEKIEQEKFLNKIVSYVIGVNDAFYLAPTFETIFTKDTKYKETLENILIKNYEKDKNITYGLILLSNQQKISETNKIKVNDIVAELNKEYGIKENDLEIPQEWYAKENPDDSLEFKFKLYFHPETDNDDPKITTHSRIMTDYFTKRGYSQHINKKSERILTKTKINKYGEKIKLKFILSNKENIKLKEDTKDAKTILIGHGGHSYDVEKTFDDYVGDDNINTKLAFLRSCGGFNQIPYINRLFEGKVQVIGTKNMGQGIVNNAILYELAEALTDKPKMWKEIYKQIEKNIQKNHPKFIECFKTYSFPGDLPSLILKYSKEQDDNYYD